RPHRLYGRHGCDASAGGQSALHPYAVRRISRCPRVGRPLSARCRAQGPAAFENAIGELKIAAALLWAARLSRTYDIRPVSIGPVASHMWGFEHARVQLAYERRMKR